MLPYCLKPVHKCFFLSLTIHEAASFIIIQVSLIIFLRSCLVYLFLLVTEKQWITMLPCPPLGTTSQAVCIAWETEGATALHVLAELPCIELLRYGGTAYTTGEHLWMDTCFLRMTDKTNLLVFPPWRSSSNVRCSYMEQTMGTTQLFVGQGKRRVQ